MNENVTLEGLLNETVGFEKLLFVADEPSEQILESAKEKLDENNTPIAMNLKLKVMNGEHKGKVNYIYMPFVMNLKDGRKYLHPTFQSLFNNCFLDKIKGQNGGKTRDEQFQALVKIFFENIDNIIGHTFEVKYKPFREYQGKKYQDVSDIKDLGILESDSNGDEKEVSF